MRKDEEKILQTRFKTTMIGALSAFEKAFGYLWGHQKKEEEELTENEQRFLDKWLDTRDQILNNGNHQLRECIRDINDKNGNGPRYSYYFKKKEME